MLQEVDLGSPLRLNLGCGRRPRHGHTNVDYIRADGVDVVVDLNAARWPFAPGSVDGIYWSHNLEHLDNPFQAVLEAHRVLRHGGRLEIIVPHWRARGARGLSHMVQGYDKNSMDSVCKEGLGLDSPALFRVLQRDVHHFCDSSFPWSRFLNGLLNRHHWILRLPIVRVSEVHWVLEKA